MHWHWDCVSTVIHVNVGSLAHAAPQNFTLVAVLVLDNTRLPPPPKPPLAPSVNGDHEIAELDPGGRGIMSYGMQDGAYYYFGSKSYVA